MKKEVANHTKVPKCYRACFMVIRQDCTLDSLICYPIGIHMIVIIAYKINKKLENFFSPLVRY